ncbi:MAG: hypothetical protein C0501_29965 [Isosphaera sp.]|nr:hypothetical protein [Isosphaera sp.]
MSHDETRDLPDPRTASQPDAAGRTADADPARTAEQSPDEMAAAAAMSRLDADGHPGYEILGLIGEGAMGGVYRARQVGLNREVAVKRVLSPGPAALARFAAEAQAMAAVRHPNVVQVHGLEEHGGRPFIVMEYVPGGSLADRLRSGPLPPRAAADLLAGVARGVAAAHDQGIVHRDLKPGNVLVAADGTPKVADFGIAKWQGVDRTTTTTAVLGTPYYMSPEQAAGRSKFVGPPADVWALGVMLYECLSGARPFEGETVQVLLSRIQTDEPAALRARLRGVPRDLDTIVGKCLSKEPADRYPTAAELADDLGRFVRGEPIAARPVGRAERFARWVRRKPTTAAAWGVSALAALLAVVVFVVVGFWRDAEGARGQAVSARDEAVELKGIADTARVGEADARRQVEQEREKLARFEYGRTVQVAHQEWRDNNVKGALTLLDGTRKDLRGWEWRYVHTLCHGQVLTLSLGQRVNSAVFSPDGTRVLTVSKNQIARIWDVRTGDELFALRPRGTALPDGGAGRAHFIPL